MKNLIGAVFLLLFASSLTYSQTLRVDSIQTSMYKSGAELIKFNSVHTLGLTFEIIGLGISGITLATTPPNESATGVVAGGVISLIGAIVELTAYKHIKKAGMLLQNNGVMIPIPIRKKGNLQQRFKN